MPKRVLAKRIIFIVEQGLNTQPHNYQANAQPINQIHCFMIILTHLGL